MNNLNPTISDFVEIIQLPHAALLNLTEDLLSSIDNGLITAFLALWSKESFRYCWSRPPYKKATLVWIWWNFDLGSVITFTKERKLQKYMGHCPPQLYQLNAVSLKVLLLAHFFSWYL